MGVGQWAGWYNFKPGDIREKTGRSCMNKPSGYLGEEHSRQRGRQWKELGQEARLVCLKNSKDAERARWYRVMPSLIGPCKHLSSASEWDGGHLEQRKDMI